MGAGCSSVDIETSLSVASYDASGEAASASTPESSLTSSLAKAKAASSEKTSPEHAGCFSSPILRTDSPSSCPGDAGVGGERDHEERKERHSPSPSARASVAVADAERSMTVERTVLHHDTVSSLELKKPRSIFDSHPHSLLERHHPMLERILNGEDPLGVDDDLPTMRQRRSPSPSIPYTIDRPKSCVTPASASSTTSTAEPTYSRRRNASRSLSTVPSSTTTANPSAEPSRTVPESSRAFDDKHLTSDYSSTNTSSVPSRYTDQEQKSCSSLFSLSEEQKSNSSLFSQTLSSSGATPDHHTHSHSAFQHSQHPHTRKRVSFSETLPVVRRIQSASSALASLTRALSTPISVRQGGARSPTSASRKTALAAASSPSVSTGGRARASTFDDARLSSVSSQKQQQQQQQMSSASHRGSHTRAHTHSHLPAQSIHAHGANLPRGHRLSIRRRAPASESSKRSTGKSVSPPLKPVHSCAPPRIKIDMDTPRTGGSPHFVSQSERPRTFSPVALGNSHTPSTGSGSGSGSGSSASSSSKGPRRPKSRKPPKLARSRTTIPGQLQGFSSQHDYQDTMDFIKHQRDRMRRQARTRVNRQHATPNASSGVGAGSSSSSSNQHHSRSASGQFFSHLKRAMSWNNNHSSASPIAASASSHDNASASDKGVAAAAGGRGAGASRGGGNSSSGHSRDRTDGTGALREKLAVAQQRSLKGSGHPDRVLLLGARGSGKSTLFKQLTQLKSSGYPSADRMQFASDIRTHVVASIQQLLELATVSPINQFSKQMILSLRDDAPWEPAVSQALLEIWEDEGFQEAYKNMYAIVQVATNLEYFAKNIEAIADRNYVPSFEDILRVSRRSTGIVTLRMKLRDTDTVPYELCDVGGTRNERRKWIHVFGGAKVIFFTASLLEYSEVLFEDATTNSLDESLQLFDEICGSRWFTDIPIVLLLTKCDLLEKRLKWTSFTHWRQDYDGHPSYYETCEFVKAEFARRYYKHRKDNALRVQILSTVDRTAIKHLTKSAVDIIDPPFMMAAEDDDPYAQDDKCAECGHPIVDLALRRKLPYPSYAFDLTGARGITHSYPPTRVCRCPNSEETTPCDSDAELDSASAVAVTTKVVAPPHDTRNCGCGSCYAKENNNLENWDIEVQKPVPTLPRVQTASLRPPRHPRVFHRTRSVPTNSILGVV